MVSIGSHSCVKVLNRCALTIVVDFDQKRAKRNGLCGIGCKQMYEQAPESKLQGERQNHNAITRQRPTQPKYRQLNEYI